MAIEVYFEKEYKGASGNKNIKGFSRKATESFPGEKDSIKDSDGRPRWNDSENRYPEHSNPNNKE